MNDGPINPNLETPQRMTGRGPRLRNVLLSIAVTFVMTISASAMIIPSTAFAAGNANFIGTWKVSGGLLGFTIKGENVKTGACVGRTASATYHLIGCHVTGNRYSFTITYGSGYRSHNSGTISGAKLSGKFSDSNGTVQVYTATR